MPSSLHHPPLPSPPDLRSSPVKRTHWHSRARASCGGGAATSSASCVRFTAMICARHHSADTGSKGTPEGSFAGKDAPWPVKISFVNKIVPLWSGRIVSVTSGACARVHCSCPPRACCHHASTQGHTISSHLTIKDVCWPGEGECASECQWRSSSGGTQP
jgi:hypothetical protein